MAAPLVVGIGGSNRPGSTTERLLNEALRVAEARGARTAVFDGAFLSRLPIFGTDGTEQSEDSLTLARTVAGADGVVLASPGYHGGLSGLVKNGIDHLELLRADARPYLDGRPVATLVTAAGWQACGTALVSLRSTVHALRGWPTPFGAAVNTAEPVYDDAGRLVGQVGGAIGIMVAQLMDFLDRGRSDRVDREGDAPPEPRISHS
jgi:FMN reductase